MFASSPHFSKPFDVCGVRITSKQWNTKLTEVMMGTVLGGWLSVGIAGFLAGPSYRSPAHVEAICPYPPSPRGLPGMLESG